MLRRSAIMVVSFATLAAGCGSSEGSTSVGTDPVDTVAVASAPTTVEGQSGGVGGAIAVAAGAIDNASAQTCDIDRKTLETASEAFYAMTGAFPTSQAELVDAAILLEPSPGFDVAPGEVIVARADGPCVGR